MVLTLRTSYAPKSLEDYRWVAERLNQYDRLLFENSADGAVTIAATDSDIPTGGITFYERLGWTFIERLWVEPSRRQAGIGTALITQCEMFASDRHHLGIRVLTTTGHGALKLYLSLGYTVDARWPFVARHGERLEELALSKVLSNCG